MNTKKIIPIVFAVDNNYAPYLAVSIESIISNASKNYLYNMYVLNTNLSEINKERLSAYNSENVKLEFIDVTKELDEIGDKLYLRDYYTNTTYYRFFIPALFPQYDKALYLDADIVVLGDISQMYNENIDNKLVGAIQEEVMSSVQVFGNYVEECLDIPCEQYFNAGVMLMNLNMMREQKIEEGFVKLLKQFKFEVTQDQDYLNVLCKNKSKILSLGWNKTPIENESFNENDLKLIHYKIAWKPWHYDNVLFGDYFWQYASKTSYYKDILLEKENYNDNKKLKDQVAYENLVKLAIKYSNDENNYKRINQRMAHNEITRKIEHYRENCQLRKAKVVE